MSCRHRVSPSGLFHPLFYFFLFSNCRRYYFPSSEQLGHAKKCGRSQTLSCWWKNNEIMRESDLGGRNRSVVQGWFCKSSADMFSLNASVFFILRFYNLFFYRIIRSPPPRGWKKAFDQLTLMSIFKPNNINPLLSATCTINGGEKKNSENKKRETFEGFVNLNQFLIFL